MQNFGAGKQGLWKYENVSLLEKKALLFDRYESILIIWKNMGAVKWKQKSSPLSI